MEKHFCDYNQSLALKKLGFEEPCMGKYDTKQGYEWLLNIYSAHLHTQFGKQNKACIAPLKSQVFEWFREKYKIEAVVACYYSKILDISYGERQYHCHIVRDGVTTKGPKFKTYDEAESKTIDKLIEIVKTNLDK